MALPTPINDGCGREILSRLLTGIEPDVDEVADRLIARFGSFGGVLHAPGDIVELEFAAHVRHRLKAVSEAVAFFLRERLWGRPLTGPHDVLVRYLIGTMGDNPREQVRVLYLNSGNHLIRDEIIAEGTARRAIFTPRTILFRAMQLDAAALLVAHNHPGGIAKPSAADIRVTTKLARVAQELEITLHDHLIIAGDRYFSMRGHGMLE